MGVRGFGIPLKLFRVYRPNFNLGVHPAGCASKRNEEKTLVRQAYKPKICKVVYNRRRLIAHENASAYIAVFF